MPDYQELADAIKGDVVAILNSTPFNMVQDEISNAIFLRVGQAAAKGNKAPVTEGKDSEIYIKQMGIAFDMKELLRRCYYVAFGRGVNNGYLHKEDMCWERDKHSFEDIILEITSKLTATPCK